MATPDTLEFDALFKPIDGDSPAGLNLREDYSPTSAYHHIKDARMSARDAERILETAYDDEEAASARPNWNPVLNEGQAIIATQSKDIEVAAWLIEALVRDRGFAGLRDGFRLVSELANQFWDGLHPMPDEDGMVTRVMPLIGLNGEDSEGVLIRPINAIPITASGSDREFSTGDHQIASELSEVALDQQKWRIEQGAATLAQFSQGVSQTPAEFYQTLLADIDEALAAHQAMTLVLDQRCDEHNAAAAAEAEQSGQARSDMEPVAVPSSNIQNAIASVRATVVRIAADKLAVDAPPEAPEAALADAANPGNQPVDGAPPAKVASMKAAVANRDQAYQTLLRVAEFFRKTEPHNPVSYLLEQAVRWGRTPLPELMQELIDNSDAREHYFRLVGVPKPDPKADAASKK